MIIINLLEIYFQETLIIWINVQLIKIIFNHIIIIIRQVIRKPNILATHYSVHL